MATIDPNGVLIYQDTDNYTPIQTALNLAQSNLSSILGANTQIVRVSSVGDRNAKATARGSISKANPFVSWRADATDGLQLEYTTNGTTWRVIADKEYYDAQDTGWVGVTPAAGYTATVALQVRRIGQVVYWRGRINKTSGNFTAGVAEVVVAAGGVPANCRPTSFNHTVQIATNGSGAATAAVTVGTDGTMQINAGVASNNFYVVGLSGYLAN